MRLPLALITGFLGSGKTTFLQYTARRLAGRRIVYLVNEFSHLDIDGRRLREIAPETVVIPGGSIFCRCLVSELVRQLRSIPARFHAAATPIAGVVIEASGIANPKVIGELLAETGLSETYALGSIVSITDPGTLPKLLHTLPAIRAQLEAADIVLLNKTDLFSGEQIEAATVLIREISPGIQLIRTVHGEAAVDLFPATPVAHSELQGDYAPCADPHFARGTLLFDRPVDITKLTAHLQAVGGDLYRAKGFVPTPNGIVYLDLSTTGIHVRPQRTATVY
jgi:G3E family GTPase